MADEITPSPEGECESAADVSRRRFLSNVCYGLGGVAVVALAAPMGAFVLSPLLEKVEPTWRRIDKVEAFKIGETVEVSFVDSSPLAWSGVSAKTAAWLRRNGDTGDAEKDFTAFAVNCSHLGCPVRWLPKAGLFMCPCHGGVYYQDGTVAGGPPPNPLTTYKVRVQDDAVEILATAVPISTD